MQRAIQTLALVLSCVVVNAGVATSVRAQDTEGAKFDAPRIQQLIAEEKFEEAADLLEKAVAAQPDNGQAVFFLGYALHMSGQVEKALEVHQKAAEFEQFQPIATYNIGCAYALLGDPAKAMAALEQAVEYGFRDGDQFAGDADLDPLKASPRWARLMARVDGFEELEKQLEMGQQQIQEGEFEKAVETYREILQKHKDHGFAHYRLGYALHANGQLDDAIEQHKKAAKYKPFAPVATYNLACALALKGEKEMALDTLRKAVDVGFSQADYMLGDSDLVSIRDEQRFVDLVEEIRENQEKAAESKKAKPEKQSSTAEKID